MAHCSTVLLRCMDLRLEGPIHAFLEDARLVGDCDVVSLAGAAKALAAPAKPAHFETAMDQVALAENLHGIRTVILMNHEDCGAYGGRQAFGSAEAEQQAHAADMARAAEIIRAAHPKVAVQKVLARIGEDGEVSFHTIP